MDTDRIITTATSGDEAKRAASVAVLPIGSFEQHGEYLPLTTDTLIASLIADRICNDYDLFKLPPVTVACSHEHFGFAGTVSISSTTLAAVVSDIWTSLRASGYRALVVVNGHGGNYVLQNIAQEANTNGPVMALFPTSWDVHRAREVAHLQTSGAEDMHGGEYEVSLLLHGAPEVVRPNIEKSDTQADWSKLLLTGMHGASPTSGVIGRPSLATAEKGAALLDSLSESFASHLVLLTSGESEGDPAI
jgi:creatinine amidohydrolase/Fe(II)-dependent formamide hydrolase-like protein